MVLNQDRGFSLLELSDNSISTTATRRIENLPGIARQLARCTVLYEKLITASKGNSDE